MYLFVRVFKQAESFVFVTLTRSLTLLLPIPSEVTLCRCWRVKTHDLTDYSCQLDPAVPPSLPSPTTDLIPRG